MTKYKVNVNEATPYEQPAQLIGGSDKCPEEEWQPRKHKIAEWIKEKPI